MASLYSALPRAREVLCSTIISSGTFIKHPIRMLQPPPPVVLIPHPTPPHRLRHRRYCTSLAVSSVAKQTNQIISSPELVALEYAELNLTDKFSEELGHVRIRQHVNPLRSYLMIPAEVPNWNEVFKDPTLPLMVDVGSGSGRFIMWLAKRNSDRQNYLGLEIRQKLVKRAQYWLDELALRNIHFIFTNATVSFHHLVSTYPGPLMLVSILCPDPHFKKKYHKRRVVQKPLVDYIVDSLAPGGQVFIQSDVHEVAFDMRSYFDAESDNLLPLENIDPNVVCDTEGWLLSNPLGIRTEREIYAEFEGSKIYRRMYQKQI
ncbi:unnamed protein product [Ilex paraguariensis]|uniref:tRNA (guanine(46)-N(7))-methyltransferase n=1 Tax=Ilex paraguariensis TaxID=185542 RepID=A0ABC8RML6_9AQUA